MTHVAPAFAVWITGLPASGKSTITRALTQQLSQRGIDVAVLESDALRPVLTPRATYSDEDREGFYRAVAYIGSLLVSHGVPVIFDATGNRRVHRAHARSAIDRFVEVFVDCPIEVCIARDPKGLYRKARSREATNLPGLQSTYEPPERPDLVVSGHRESAEGSAQAIIRLLEERAYITRS